MNRWMDRRREEQNGSYIPPTKTLLAGGIMGFLFMQTVNNYQTVLIKHTFQSDSLHRVFKMCFPQFYLYHNDH